MSFVRCFFLFVVHEFQRRYVQAIFQKRLEAQKISMREKQEEAFKKLQLKRNITHITIEGDESASEFVSAPALISAPVYGTPSSSLSNVVNFLNYVNVMIETTSTLSIRRIVGKASAEI